jgi:transcriptional regulator with XRE-family HTH domain
VINKRIKFYLFRVVKNVVFLRNSTHHKHMQISEQTTYLRVIQLRLSNARLKYRLTQEQVAAAANMPVRSYQGLEGFREARNFNPTLLTLRAVAQAVGINICDLIRETDPDEIVLLEKVIQNRSTRRISKALSKD